MGSSTISFHNNNLDIRTTDLAFAMGTIVHEGKMAAERGSAVARLLNEIEANAWLSGYTCWIRLEGIVRTPADIDEVIVFLLHLKKRIKDLGAEISESYARLIDPYIAEGSVAGGWPAADFLKSLQGITNLFLSPQGTTEWYMDIDLDGSGPKSIER